MAAYMRSAASPGAVKAVMEMNREIDVRHVLPTIRVPTLIAHRIGDRNIRIQQAQYMANRIPGSKLVELPGDDHIAWFGDIDALLGEVEEFLTGVRPEPIPDRVLATILFTDIVGATEKAADLGDQEWSRLLARHNELIREELIRFRGREIDTAGDGFFVTFDGPARAISCAKAIQNAVTKLGLTVRIGLHTGECEKMDEKISGIAVHICARVVNHAAPGEILVTSTVKDLVAGSGISFTDQGEYELKGVPGEWRLFKSL